MARVLRSCWSVRIKMALSPMIWRSLQLSNAAEDAARAMASRMIKSQQRARHVFSSLLAWLMPLNARQQFFL
jgi:hypothetical protein